MTTQPNEEVPPLVELLYEIGILLAVMLGLALVANLSFGTYMSS